MALPSPKRYRNRSVLTHNHVFVLCLMEQTICWLMQLASLRRLIKENYFLMVEFGSEAKGKVEAQLSNHLKPAKPAKSDDRTALKLLK